MQEKKSWDDKIYFYGVFKEKGDGNFCYQVTTINASYCVRVGVNTGFQTETLETSLPPRTADLHSWLFETACPGIIRICWVQLQ